MPSLYPNDIASLKRILHYAKRMNGLDVFAEQFKRVLIASGMSIFNKYKQEISSGKKHNKVNWDYVKELADTSYKTSIVHFHRVPHL